MGPDDKPIMMNDPTSRVLRTLTTTTKYKIILVRTGGSGIKLRESHRPLSICVKRVMIFMLLNIRTCLTLITPLKSLFFINTTLI
jgi:hypothetical protein